MNQVINYVRIGQSNELKQFDWLKFDLVYIKLTLTVSSYGIQVSIKFTASIAIYTKLQLYNRDAVSSIRQPVSNS